MNIPLCHKCVDGLFALNVDCPHKSQTFVGCRRDSRITNHGLACIHCPILPREEEVIDVETVVAVPVRFKPTKWCDMFGVQVVDPDGWRHGHKPDWNTAITRDMFIERYNMSTTRIVDREKYRRWRHVFEKRG